MSSKEAEGPTLGVHITTIHEAVRSNHIPLLIKGSFGSLLHHI